SGAQPPDITQLQTGVLDREVRGILLQAEAEEAGVEVSPAQVDQQYQQQVQSQGGSQEEIDTLLAQNGFDEQSCKAAPHDDMLAQAVVQQSGGDAQALTESLTERATETDVQISPRFGSWEGIQLAQGTGSISQASDDGGGQTAPPGGQP